MMGHGFSPVTPVCHYLHHPCGAQPGLHGVYDPQVGVGGTSRSN